MNLHKISVIFNLKREVTFTQLLISGYLNVDTYPNVNNCLYTGTLFYLTICNFSLGPLRVTAGNVSFAAVPVCHQSGSTGFSSTCCR
jgi:hypothetical protein